LIINNDIDILISSDYGKINAKEELKKLFEKLNLNSDTLNNHPHKWGGFLFH
jgi:hypothetical protein